MHCRVCVCVCVCMRAHLNVCKCLSIQFKFLKSILQMQFYFSSSGCMFTKVSALSRWLVTNHNNSADVLILQNESLAHSFSPTPLLKFWRDLWVLNPYVACLLSWGGEKKYLRSCSLRDVQCTMYQMSQKHQFLTFSMKKEQGTRRKGPAQVAHCGEHGHYQVPTSKSNISLFIWLER